MKGLVAVLVAIVVLGGGYYLLSSPNRATDLNVNVDGMNGSTPTTTNTPSTNSGSTTASTTPTTGTGTQGAVKEFTVTSTGMAFNQKALSVNKGDRVKITYTNGGGTHDLRVDGYNVGTKVIQGGASETFEFVADKAGTFEYYCSVGEHRKAGMKGTLTVK